MTIITAMTLRQLGTCERRVWLDEHGGQRETVSPAVFAGGINHEQLVSAAMFGKVTPVRAADWPELVRVTRTLMARGAAGIQGGAFERTWHDGITVRGRVDWLRRVAQPSQLRAWSYEPVEIKLRREINDNDRLQLDLYLWLLEAAQGVETTGWFWMGRDSDNRPLHVIEHTLDEMRLRGAIAHAAAITAGAAPPIFFGGHCEGCGWRSACGETAAARRDIALLPGLSRQTWLHMRQTGMQTLDDLLALPESELSRFKGVGKVRALEIHTHARSVVTGMPVPRHPLPDKVKLPGVMLDLETRLDDGRVWCFGWQGVSGRTEAAIVDAYCEMDDLTLPDGEVIHIIPDSDTGWRLVAAAALELPGPVYHWGSFQKGVLRGSAPADVIAALDHRLLDLNRTFRQTVAVPVRGTSIKKVAPYLGFYWPDGADVFAAWADYNRWLQDGDALALARACAYNRADVDALALIWRWMVDNQL